MFFLGAIFVATEGGQWPVGISRRCKCPKAPPREHTARVLFHCYHSKSFPTVSSEHLGIFCQGLWLELVYARLRLTEHQKSRHAQLFRLGFLNNTIDEGDIVFFFGVKKIISPLLDNDDIEGKLLREVRRFSKDCFYNRKW